MDSFSRQFGQHQLLQDRIAYSSELVKEVRGAVRGLRAANNPNVCVFVAGSLGRLEMGRKSDLDVFFVADGKKPTGQTRCITKLQEIEIFSDLIRLNEQLSLPSFSGDGRYLKIHELDDLVGATGDSDRDDSENLFTTRLLLILESQALSNDGLYDAALKKVLDNYFRDDKGRKDFRPLFLLNDLLRYWRTLCLNYEQQRTLKKPWWKSNLNLKFSRKLTVYSTVLGVVSKQIETTDQFLKYSQMIPLKRLANVLDGIGDSNLLEPFSRLLDDYEAFLAAKSHADLEEQKEKALREFSEKAQTFGSFFLNALQSKKLDQRLVNYVLI